MSAPIGILGGTFDPIHFGHLRLAQEVADQLRLAEVRFVPGGTPPHRAAPAASAADRLAMVRLAVAGNALFTVDARETVARLLPSLSERTRRIVELRFYDELSQSEIAEAVGVSQMHVSRLLRHALDQMAAMMAAEPAIDDNAFP